MSVIIERSPLHWKAAVSWRHCHMSIMTCFSQHLANTHHRGRLWEASDGILEFVMWSGVSLKGKLQGLIFTSHLGMVGITTRKNSLFLSPSHNHTHRSCTQKARQYDMSDPRKDLKGRVMPQTAMFTDNNRCLLWGQDEQRAHIQKSGEVKMKPWRCKVLGYHKHTFSAFWHRIYKSLELYKRDEHHSSKGYPLN